MQNVQHVQEAVLANLAKLHFSLIISPKVFTLVSLINLRNIEVNATVPLILFILFNLFILAEWLHIRHRALWECSI